MRIEDQIIQHYQRYDESARLAQDIGPLELARTQELIAHHLPPAPANVLDVGGGTGVYSFWLAGLGYRVQLVDIVPRHIEQARQAPQAAQLAGLSVGDARQLDFPAESFDAIVMHGPLYHLAERADRLRALGEARRVLRPGGVLLAFGITRYAGLIYGLRRGLVFDPDYHRMIRDELASGQRLNPPPGVFTLPNAYFHLPAELEAEIAASGLLPRATLGVLGPVWMVPDLEASWNDPAQRAVLLDLARLTENEPVLGPRILTVAVRS